MHETQRSGINTERTASGGLQRLYEELPSDASTGPSSFDGCTRVGCFHDSFSHQQMVRDLNKAWLGFSKCVTLPVSTGHWGCGAFGGNKTLKFLQQLCASSLAGTPLEYSTYRDTECKQWFQQIHATLLERSVSVKQVVEMILNEKNTKDSFEDYCISWMNSL